MVNNDSTGEKQDVLAQTKDINIKTGKIFITQRLFKEMQEVSF